MLTFCSECPQQTAKLHFAFTVASSCNLIANLILGLVFDSFGPRVCKTISSSFILLGSTLIAFAHPRSSPESQNDLFLPGLSLLGFGGTGIQLASIHLSNLFPEMKSFVTCLIVGSFQLSFSIFMIFQEISTHLHLSHQVIFLGFNLIIIFNLACSILLNPDTPFQDDEAHSNLQQTQSSRGICLPSVFREKGIDLLALTPDRKKRKLPSEKTNLIKTNQDLSKRSFRSQLFSTSFILALIYFSNGALWSNYVVGSFKYQMEREGMIQENVDYLMQWFNISLPGGVIFIPLVGYIIEYFSFPIAFSICNVFALIYTCLFSSQLLHAIMIGIIFYTAYRTLLYSLIFAYIGQRFGYQSFGALSGVLFTSAAIVGFLQAPISNISNIFLTYIIQIIGFLCSFSFPLYEMHIMSPSRSNK